MRHIYIYNQLNEIAQVMEDAHKKAKNSIQFKDVVLALAEYEYRKLRGPEDIIKDMKPTMYGEMPKYFQHLFIIKAVVEEIIPPNL